MKKSTTDKIWETPKMEVLHEISSVYHSKTTTAPDATVVPAEVVAAPNHHEVAEVVAPEQDDLEEGIADKSKAMLGMSVQIWNPYVFEMF